MLARRIKKTYAVVKTALFAIGVFSVMLPFFRIDSGDFSFLVHMILASILFLTIPVSVVGTSLRLPSSTNKLLSVLTMLLYGQTLLGFWFDSPTWVDLPIGQILIIAVFGIWLHANMSSTTKLTNFLKTQACFGFNINCLKW